MSLKSRALRGIRRAHAEFMENSTPESHPVNGPNPLKLPKFNHASWRQEQDSRDFWSRIKPISKPPAIVMPAAHGTPLLRETDGALQIEPRNVRGRKPTSAPLTQPDVAPILCRTAA